MRIEIAVIIDKSKKEDWYEIHNTHYNPVLKFKTVIGTRNEKSKTASLKFSWEFGWDDNDMISSGEATIYFKKFIELPGKLREFLKLFDFGSNYPGVSVSFIPGTNEELFNLVYDTIR